MIDFVGSPAWTNSGPNPIASDHFTTAGAVQGVVALRVSRPGQPATYTLYAATINGGIWRSDNFTDSMLQAQGHAPPAIRWSPLSDQAPTLSACSLALDPFDLSGNTLWVGTGLLSSGPFGGSAIGFLKTTTGKSAAPSWTVLGASATRPTDVSLAGQRIVSVVPTTITDARSRQPIILVAALDGQGILRSQDGGQTFQTVNGPAGPLSGQATDLVADPNDPYTFFAAIAAAFQGQNLTSSGGVFRSKDGGINWSRIDSGIPQVSRSVSLELAIFNNAAGTAKMAGPTVLYVGQANTTGNDNNLIGLFRSSNPSANAPQWTALFSSPNPANIPNGLTRQQWPAAAKVPWFAMAVEPADWNNIYLGGMSWLYRVRVTVSATGAVSTLWAAWDALGGWDHRSLNYIASNILIGTGDPGIFGLADNASQWTSLNNSLSVTEFYAVAYDSTRGLVFGGAQDVGTPVQNNRGGWNPLPNGGGDGGLALVGSDGVYYYATNGGFLRDRNGSAVAPAGVPRVNSDHGVIVNPANPRQLMVAGGTRLFESLDQGDSVRDITPAGMTGTVTAFAYGTNNASAAYVGTSTGQLLLRTNGNGAPVAVASYPGAGAQVDDIGVDYADWRRAAVISDDGRVFFTTDAGARWTNIRGNVGNVLRFMRRIQVVKADNDVIVLIGGDPPTANSGIVRTINPDTSRANPNVVWSPFGYGLPRVNVLDLRYYPAGRFSDGNPRGDVLLAGTFGRGAWTVASPPGPSWHIHDHGQPAGTQVATAPALVTWTQPGVVVRENVFYGDANGSLIEYWFDGIQWRTHDHGKPAGVGVASAPAAVVWTQPGVPIRVNVFYEGSNGNLIAFWFDGNQWQVTDYGKPAGTGVASAPGVVAWTQAGVPVRENVFYPGANGNLIEFWFDGTRWQVSDHGRPAGTGVASTPAVVAWTQPGVAIRQNVFYRGANGNLIDLWFDGDVWNVRDHGQPAGTSVASPPAAVTWTEPGVAVRVNVFYAGANGNLIDVWFDGHQWSVRDHGQPAGTAVASAPGAVTWRDPNGLIRVNVFYQGANGNLIEVWFDGTNWNVTDHGWPGGTSVNSRPAVVSWSLAGVPVRENVFYRGFNGNLIEIWYG